MQKPPRSNGENTQLLRAYFRTLEKNKEKIKMKKATLTIVATMFSTFVISIFTFQPTTEANNNATPTATPKRKQVTRPNLNMTQPTHTDIVKRQSSTSRIRKPGTTGFTYQKIETVRSRTQDTSRTKQLRKRSTQKSQHKPF